MQPKYVNILNFVNSNSAGVLVLFETLLLLSPNTSIAYIFWYVIVSALQSHYIQLKIAVMLE